MRTTVAIYTLSIKTCVFTAVLSFDFDFFGFIDLSISVSFFSESCYFWLNMHMSEVSSGEITAC